MNRFSVIIICVILGFACHNQVSVDLSYKPAKLIDSIMTNPKLGLMQKLDFNDLSAKDVWAWRKSKKIQKVDSLFYNQCFKNDKYFGRWNDYQEYYYLGKVKVGEIFYLVIGQWIKNGDESYMYLFDFDKKGKISKSFLVAKQYKSPLDYDYCYSLIDNGKLKRTSINWWTEQDNQLLETKDSIIERFDLGNFERTNYDSVRIK